MKNDTVIEVKNLYKSFGKGFKKQVICNLNLEVKNGEFLTVVGASGCGKSTLLNLLAGLEKSSAGSITTKGKVALMFQDATLLPWLTAIQNVKLALRLQGSNKSERNSIAENLMETVRLSDSKNKRPHELSGGMKQRVSLARCFAQEASIVLMDEPLGALDAMTRDHLHDEIERLTKERGLTVIFVTHNMREAVRLGDRVVLMGSGKIVHEEIVELPHPRLMDSPEIAIRAAKLTKLLKQVEGTDELLGSQS